MAIKNIKTLLTQATALPAAVEAKLPAGAPKVSTMLLDAAGMIPAAIPDFPMEIPDLPAVPTLPTLPGGAPAELTRSYVTAVEVRPVSAPASVARREIIPSPSVGVLPEVVSRRGI